MQDTSALANVREPLLVELARSNEDLFAKYPYLFLDYKFEEYTRLIGNFKKALASGDPSDTNRIIGMLERIVGEKNAEMRDTCAPSAFLIWAFSNPLIVESLRILFSTRTKMPHIEDTLKLLREIDWIRSRELNTVIGDYPTKCMPSDLSGRSQLIHEYLSETNEGTCRLNFDGYIVFLSYAIRFHPDLWFKFAQPELKNPNTAQYFLDQVSTNNSAMAEFLQRASDQDFEKYRSIIKLSDSQIMSMYFYAVGDSLQIAQERLKSLSDQDSDVRVLPGECNDLINMSDESIAEFIKQENALVLFVDTKNLEYINSACYTFDALSFAIENNVFYACIMGKSHRTYVDGPDEYVMINTHVGNFLVDAKVVRKIVTERKKVVHLKYYFTIPRTISKRAILETGIEEEAYVGGYHCQEGSNIDVYKVIASH